VKLSEEKIAGFRNFANKLWNISRFTLLTIEKPRVDCKEPKTKTLADEWILSKLHSIILDTTNNLEVYNFSYAGERLRDFTWSDLADWYLEIAKVEGGKSDMLNYILNTILKLWHPYMPFVTETIWQEVYGQGAMLMVEAWPTAKKSKDAGEFETIAKLVTSIRSLRSDNKIEPAKKLNALIIGKKTKLIEENSEVIKALARLEKLEIVAKGVKPAQAVGFVEGGFEVYLDLGGVVVGAVYLWVVRYELPAFFKKYETFFYVFAFSLLVGILWEIFEYYVGIDREFSYAVRRIDTVVDLIMDVSGATLSYMVFSRFKHNG
jgi:valyl-tRNA synthetase